MLCECSATHSDAVLRKCRLGLQWIRSCKDANFDTINNIDTTTVGAQLFVARFALSLCAVFAKCRIQNENMCSTSEPHSATATVQGLYNYLQCKQVLFFFFVIFACFHSSSAFRSTAFVCCCLLLSAVVSCFEYRRLAPYTVFSRRANDATHRREPAHDCKKQWQIGG